MTIWKSLPDAFQENAKCVCERGVVALWSFLILKRALELLITNPMSPLQCLYDHPFYRTLYAPTAQLTTLALKAVGGNHPQSPFNSQSNELLSKFLQQFFRYKVPWSKTKQKSLNNTLCPHHGSLRQCYCASYDNTILKPITLNTEIFLRL